jgi:DNA uptake protein ComE-like DNA-binding protein
MAKAETGPENPQVTNLMQDQKTGKLVEFIGVHDKEYAMIRDGAGKVSYVTLEQLVPYSPEKGRLSKVVNPALQVEKEEPLPKTVVPAEDARLNLNTATAEMIAKRLPGVGYTTAKRIVELKLSLSGERFSNLKQLENIPRVNWDQLIEDDMIFIA